MAFTINREGKLVHVSYNEDYVSPCDIPDAPEAIKAKPLYNPTCHEETVLSNIYERLTNEHQQIMNKPFHISWDEWEKAGEPHEEI